MISDLVASFSDGEEQPAKIESFVQHLLRPPFLSEHILSTRRVSFHQFSLRFVLWSAKAGIDSDLNGKCIEFE